MKLIKNIRKIKILLVYSLFGLICAISFVSLLLSNHLYNIRMKKTLENLDENSNFTLVLKTKKNCENKKEKLFTYENTDIYGICLKEIYISYKNLNFRLEDVLKKEYLTIEAIYKNSTKVEEESKIEKWTNEKEGYTIINNKIYEGFNEVTFNSES